MNPSTLESMDCLPRYARILDAYHRAQRPALRSMVARLPINESDRVLDVPCGDGFYSRLFAARCGEVVGADLSEAFLARARQQAERARAAADISFVAADVYDLPFESEEFDLVWCAQSMITLRNPLRALRQFHRVLRPGRSLAVLEHDPLHQVLLPWPVPLELAVQRAMLQAADRPAEFVAGRTLRQWMKEASFDCLRRHTFATDHHAPLSAEAREHLELFLNLLRVDVRAILDVACLDQFDRLTDPDSPDYLLAQADAHMTCIDMLTIGHTTMFAAEANEVFDAQTLEDQR